LKLLGYQAQSFSWTPFSQTLDDAKPAPQKDQAENAVVLFMQVEASDVGENRSRVFRKTLKHIKWMANKREIKNIVLHSFAHLGGENCEADHAQEFMTELDERLSATGYTVKQTPFGWFCAWNLSVYGESMAKVFKQI
jgi:hypothetical protein